MIIGIVLYMFFLTEEPSYSLACGARPIPPLGCKRENAVCICDEDGECYWAFVGC